MRLSPRERWIGFVTSAVASLYVWFTLQPDLLLANTTTNGGDTGAHVWWPAYLRDHILPKWRLTGWAPDWYAGFPAGVFNLVNGDGPCVGAGLASHADVDMISITGSTRAGIAVAEAARLRLAGTPCR